MTDEIREGLITGVCRALGTITGRLASRQDTVPPPDPRIVVLRRCCLGDVLSSTPLLDVLRRRFPLSRIDYATGGWASPALAGNPDVTAVVPAGLDSLRAGRYDLAITLERSPLAAMLPWLAGIPIRVGLNSLGRGFAHNVRVACPPDRSEAELYLECAAALGIRIEGARAKFCPSDGDRMRAQEQIERTGMTEHPLVCLAPGGAVNPGMTLPGKRWPAERYVRIAEELFARAGLASVLIGAASDAEVNSAVAGKTTTPVLDLTGKTTFGVTAAVIERCRLFAGNDSAPLHLAAAVGVPFVGIFGPSDPVRHRPFGRGEVVAADIPRSAYRNGFSDVDCIGLVSVEDVSAACLRLLSAAASSV